MNTKRTLSWPVWALLLAGCSSAADLPEDTSRSSLASTRAAPGADEAPDGSAPGESVAAAASDAEAPSFEEWREALRKAPVPKGGCFKAERPSTTWVEVPCVTPPDEPHRPAHRAASRSASSGAAAGGLLGSPETLGNDWDWVAQAPTNTLITAAGGSFPSVSGVTSESDFVANTYSLQLNSNQFAGSSTPQLSKLCNQGSTPSSCQGWQQFIYGTSPGNAALNLPSQSLGFIQYWLFDFTPTSTKPCPTGPAPLGSWHTSGTSCWVNNPAGTSVTAGPQPITNLASLDLLGAAGSTSDSLAIIVGQSAYSFSTTTSVLGLSQEWNQVEFNVFGANNGSEACFNSGSSITVQTALETSPQSSTAPQCIPPYDAFGTTAEFNNLNAPTCASNANGTIQFTEGNADTCLAGWGRYWPVAMQANTTSLWIDNYNSYGAIDEGLGMMSGTVPSLAVLPSSNLAIAFQANTGHLYLDQTDPSGHYVANPTDQQEVMMAGTSPSIAVTASGNLVIAYQGSNGDLWIEQNGPGSGQDQYLGMLKGTSPSVGILPNGQIVTAFQANTWSLWVQQGGLNYNLGAAMGNILMSPGSSPSLAVNSNLDGSYAIAFQAVSSALFLVQVPSSPGNFFYTNEGVYVASQTSPSVTFLTGGSPQWAFQGSNGSLFVGGTNQNMPMAKGASPTILPLPTNQFQVAFEASNSDLALDINGTKVDTWLGMNTP